MDAVHVNGEANGRADASFLPLLLASPGGFITQHLGAGLGDLYVSALLCFGSRDRSQASVPSEVFSTMMRCVCGVQFDGWKSAESYDHRAHIYVAKQQGVDW